MSHVHKSMGTLYGAPVWDVSGCPEPHEWDDRTEIEKAADSLADAIEALKWGLDEKEVCISYEEHAGLLAALAAYREATK